MVAFHSSSAIPISLTEANVRTWREVEAWFREQIMRHYLDSVFSIDERDAG
jgi:hypothetical protein